MKRHTIVIGMALFAIALGGCASAGAARDDVAPSASVGRAVASMAGHWQGTVWETGASFYQGVIPLDLQIDGDGTWRGKVGKADASGTAWMDRRGWLVLSGSARETDGPLQAIFYELRGDSVRRWGEIASGFSGRDGQGRIEHASVSIQQVP